MITTKSIERTIEDHPLNTSIRQSESKYMYKLVSDSFSEDFTGVTIYDLGYKHMTYSITAQMRSVSNTLQKKTLKRPLS